MAVSFKVEGLTGLIANVRAAQPVTVRKILNAVRTYGTDTKVTAQINARVDRGKMRDGIEDEYTDGGRVAKVGWDEAEFTSDGDPFYPIYHELGTSQMSAQPMIGPAHAKHAPILQRNVGDALREAFRGLGK